MKEQSCNKVQNSKLQMQRGDADFLLILPSLRELALCNSAHKELPLDQSNSSTLAPLSSPHPGNFVGIFQSLALLNLLSHSVG